MFFSKAPNSPTSYFALRKKMKDKLYLERCAKIILINFCSTHLYFLDQFFPTRSQRTFRVLIGSPGELANKTFKCTGLVLSFKNEIRFIDLKKHKNSNKLS
jgi:hypothetical protein